MTKQEALQLFASHVDVPALKADFPDLDYVITELEDGQQEIIIRLQGEDADFHPASDVASIDEIEVKDLPYATKNMITLRNHKNKLKRQRLRRRNNAILKRVRALLKPTGVSVRHFVKIIRHSLPEQEVGI